MNRNRKITREKMDKDDLLCALIFGAFCGAVIWEIVRLAMKAAGATP